MKRFPLNIIFISLIIVCIFFSCKKEDTSIVELKNIIIKNPPTKIKYYENDTLDISGLVISIEKDNGVIEDISFENFPDNGITCIPTNGSILNTGFENITIEHESSGVFVKQALIIYGLIPINISIKSAPTKLEYYEGDTLDLSGLEVTLSMNNGVIKDVKLVDFAINELYCVPSNGSIISEPISITISKDNEYKTIFINQNLVFKMQDIDKNDYPIVKIGNQIWMAENLRTTHYADGTEIILVENNEAWNSLLYTDKAYCYFDNSLNNLDTYGALYNWAAAMNGAVSSNNNPSEVQGVCPDGWHLPSDQEWTELIDFIGNEGHSGVEGRILKATTGWYDGNGDENGTDNYGFAALPGGWREADGIYNYLETNGSYWTSTEFDEFEAKKFGMHYYTNDVYRNGGYDKKIGNHVRCIKN